MQRSLIFIYNYWIILFYFKVDHLALMITVALKLGISPQKLQRFNSKMHSQAMHSQQTTCKMGDLCHFHKRPRLKSLNHLTHLRKDPFYKVWQTSCCSRKVYFVQTADLSISRQCSISTIPENVRKTEGLVFQEVQKWNNDCFGKQQYKIAHTQPFCHFC